MAWRQSTVAVIVVAAMVARLSASSVPASTNGWHPWQRDPPCVDLVADCGAVADGVTDDTVAFTVCQLRARASDGCVTVPAGRFACISVILNVSHIEWRMDPGATFVPWRGMTTSQPVFVIGSLSKSGPPASVSNVSITGPVGAKFTVDISKPHLAPWNVRGFMFVGDVADFTLANCFIKMADPLQDPTITITAAKSGIEFGNRGAANPRRGRVTNITSTGGSIGYGMIQAQSVQDTHFENLDGQGGSTLRLETGVGSLGAFVGNITAKTIICRNGWNAAYILPHQQKNGKLTLADFRSYGCLTTVNIGAGYYDPYRHPGETPGYYSNDSTITGVLGVFGTNAQAEVNVSNRPSCLPCEVGWPDPGSKWGGNQSGPGGLNYHIAVSGVVVQGYPSPSNRTACLQWERWQHGKEMLCPLWPQ